jgi:hypothetical protein
MSLKGPDGKEVNYLPWFPGEPNGELTKEDCVQAFNNQYADIQCKMYKYFFPCILWGETIFKLRGLLKGQTKLDTDYIFRTDLMYGGEIAFQGLLGKSSIALNKFNDTWDFKVKEANKEILIGTLRSDNQFPVGLNTWTLKDNYSDLKMPLGSDSQLKFTKARVFIYLKDQS